MTASFVKKLNRRMGEKAEREYQMQTQIREVCSFDCLGFNAPEVCVQKEKQEENNMDAIIRNEQSQRNYLEHRVYDVRNEKLTEAREKFYMDGDGVPSTWTDLLQRIADGKFVYNKAAAEANEYIEDYGTFAYVEWRDPNKPADKAGFNAFAEKLEKAEMDAKDQIRVASPELGLKALNEFKTFSVQ